MELRRFLMLVALVVVIMLIAIAWLFPSNDDFGTGNPFWNGARDTGSLMPLSPLSSLSDLPSAPSGATLILIPYLSFTPPELDALKRFATGGGTLVIADDFGFGNQVLEYLGLKARFSGQALLDPLMHYKNKWFPRIYHVKASPLTSNSDNMVFNHATGLLNVDAEDALALSSSLSFLDLNDNGRGDTGEPVGPIPVIAQQDLGRGKLVLITDPSIFINSMDRREGNATLIRNISATAPSGLFLDQSHLPTSNLQQTKNLLTVIHDFLATPLATVGVVIVAVTATLLAMRYRRKTIGEKSKRAHNNNYHEHFSTR